MPLPFTSVARDRRAYCWSHAWPPRFRLPKVTVGLSVLTTHKTPPILFLSIRWTLVVAGACCEGINRKGVDSRSIC